MTSNLLTGDHPQPLFVQVYHRLSEAIRSGAIQPGDRLPPERSLIEEFQVSRATIRRALHQLVEDGLVEASQGRGWFVRMGPVSEPPNTLMSVTELGRRNGLTPSALVLEQFVRSASLEEAQTFGIAPGAEVFCLTRLRMFDGIAVVVDESRVPLTRAPQLPTIDFTTASLMAELEAAGAGPVRADYVMRASAASDQHARHLGTDPGAPVLITLTTSYDAQGRIVELTKGTYHGDRYQFRATLLRRAGEMIGGRRGN